MSFSLAAEDFSGVRGRSAGAGRVSSGVVYYGRLGLVRLEARSDVQTMF